MGAYRWMPWVQLNCCAVLVLMLGGCPGGNQTTTTTTPPATTPPPVGSTLPLGCPTVSDPAPSCPGVAVTELKLACSGAVSAVFDSVHTNRIGVTVPNNSVVTGNVRGTPGVLLPGEVCHGIGAKFAINIKLGAQYIGDLGPNAPVCIMHSKLSFPQFDTSGSIFNAAWNPTIEGQIQGNVHMQIDQAVVSNLGTPATAPTRCAGYSDLP
jgi:hypothetical protein